MEIKKQIQIAPNHWQFFVDIMAESKPVNKTLEQRIESTLRRSELAAKTLTTLLNKADENIHDIVAELREKQPENMEATFIKNDDQDLTSLFSDCEALKIPFTRQIKNDLHKVGRPLFSDTFTYVKGYTWVTISFAPEFLEEFQRVFQKHKLFVRVC